MHRKTRPAELRIGEGSRIATARDWLWSMTPDERIDAMRSGFLTYAQLREWTARAPHEVPLLGGELEWLVVLDPDFCE